MSAFREILAAFSIDVDTKPIEKGHSAVDGLVSKLQTFGKAAAGLFAVDMFAGMIRSTVQQADELDRAASVAGLAADEYQRLVHAADMLDVSAGSLSAGIGFLQRNLVAAREGSKEASETFNKLGISLDSASGTNTVDLLAQVADGIQGIEDPAKQTALAMGAFGRGGRELLPMLKEGGAAIREYATQVDQLGGGFGNQFIELAGKADNLEKEFALMWRSFRAQIVGSVLPTILEWGKALQGIGQAVFRLNKDGAVMRAAWIGGALAIGLKLAAMLPTFKSLASGAALFAKGVLLPAAGLILLTLLLEDLFVWFTGGKSIVGDFFDLFDTRISDSAQIFGETFGFMMSSWDNFVATIMAVPSFVGMAFTALDNEITQGVSYAIAFLQDQWVTFLQSLQLPSWAQTLLGGDSKATGTENQDKASKAWDQSREQIGTRFTREIETNPNWQRFQEARDKARLDALPSTTPGVKEGTPWKSMVEGQGAMPQPVATTPPPMLTPAFAGATQAEIPSPLAPVFAPPATVAIPAPAAIQNTSVVTNNVEHKPVVNVTIPGGNQATVKASVTKALSDSNAGLVASLEHTKD